MTGLFKKIQTAVKNRTTYRTGLLQAKAYRILKQFTAKELVQYDISTVDWALLGILADSKSGSKPSALALELGVEAPFITVLIGVLKKKGLVESMKDPQDSRAKIIYLTDKGIKFVAKVENNLRDTVSVLIAGIPKSDLVTYLSVLERIIENGSLTK